MKNLINYYYGIIVNEFKKRDASFIFYINNIEFELKEFYGDINELINLYSLLKAYRREVDEIIINSKNNFITYYESKPYILIKKINILRKKIELEDIINYDCRVHVNGKINWKNLWINKIDYYEMQLEELGIKYPLLKKSFNYYRGLSEIAIALLNYVDYKNINYSISHRRLEKNDDIFNPLNIIIDSRTRDIAEYVKIKYLNENMVVQEIIEFIERIGFSKDEITLLISRLIYPSYYFDMYENIFAGKESEKELNKIIKKNAEYEAFLKEFYNNVKLIYTIPQIEFLEY